MAEEAVILKAEKYLSLVKDFVAIDTAYLFGSQANGVGREDSDIDIAIFTKELRSDYFELLKKLFAARRQVDVLIEPHLLIAGNDGSGFHDEVRKGIRLI